MLSGACGDSATVPEPDPLITWMEPPGRGKVSSFPGKGAHTAHGAPLARDRVGGSRGCECCLVQDIDIDPVPAFTAQLSIGAPGAIGR